MKIAFCVSGACRIKPEQAKKLHHDRLSVMPSGMDVYLHTWNRFESYVPKEFKDNLLLTKEPTVSYNPLTETKALDKSPKYKQFAQSKLFKTSNSNPKHKNSTKQILAHADVVSSFDYNDYDVIVRCRWDSVLGRIDFIPWLEQARDVGPVGFMTRVRQGYDVNNIVLAEKSYDDKDWSQYLPDILIFHAPRHFDPQLVYNLDQNKELRAAEWGWYQVISEPYGDIHTSIKGGAKSSDGPIRCQ